MESSLLSEKLFLKIQLGLLFLYLVFFPFGKLPHLLSQIVGIKVFLDPTDIVIMISSFLGILFYLANFLNSRNSYKKEIFFANFINLLIFSFLLSIYASGIKSVFYPGFFYLIRLVAYLFFFSTVRILVKNKLIFKEFLLKILLTLGIIIAVVGLAQFIFIPDMRALHTFGWDDHYYRLLSTFLDPAFSGILILLSLILSVHFLVKTKFEFRFILTSLILLVALALTYSRSSYLALGVLTLFLLLRGIKLNLKIITLVFVGMLLIFIAPRPGGEGVNLLRTRSLELKLANFNQSFKVFSRYPLFGVGYNNICLTKERSNFVYEDHSCSGLDNSPLFLLATTGVLGFVAFGHSIVKILNNLKESKYFIVFLLSILAILIHSQFTNTLVYPAILGWLAILQS